MVFAVADVADAPFADSRFDVVMSVLSPWNYKECSAGFQTFERKRLCYTKTLAQPDLERLVKMTPLTWKCTDASIQRFISRKEAAVTIDIDILIGTDPL